MPFNKVVEQKLGIIRVSVSFVSVDSLVRTVS